MSLTAEDRIAGVAVMTRMMVPVIRLCFVPLRMNGWEHVALCGPYFEQTTNG